MSSKALITKFASKDGVDARVVERDYVLAHIVALISSNDAERKLILKGGTSLRLLHFDGHRYSADLDYSVVKGSKAEALDVVRSALAKGQHPAAIKQLSLTEASDRIMYMGPLGAERTIVEAGAHSRSGRACPGSGRVTSTTAAGSLVEVVSTDLPVQ